LSVSQLIAEENGESEPRLIMHFYGKRNCIAMPETKEPGNSPPAASISGLSRTARLE